MGWGNSRAAGNSHFRHEQKKTPEKLRIAAVVPGLLHLLLLREINPPEAWKPTWAQGIEAEIPEELERKARFLR
ncbi:MAG: hypothetical protein LBG10_06885, partial [Treponema sp.]|nr:hypothetical protein [Treponema sp.]